MMLDYNSLLIALGVSASCLAITLIGSWLTRRVETFLLTCAIGLFFVVAGIFSYSFYVAKPIMAMITVTFILFSVGFSLIWAAGYQFRTHRLSWSRIIVSSLTNIVLTVPTTVSGYDGLAYIFDNTVVALLLLATAREYWLSRSEAPAPLYGVSVLYTATATTFALCACVLIFNGQLSLGKAPNNWAEDLSIAVSLASMTGIGALSLALHQWRQAALHRVAAMTDPLTGLMNRRALFEMYGARQFTAVMAVIIFDIDRFKSVNDGYGHAAGDGMLKLFAEELSGKLRPLDVVARLGGEEFVLVLSDVRAGHAENIADRIRRSFESRELLVDGRSLRCTVSAGIAFGANGDFDSVLSAADRALYAAKRNGRNRIERADHLHAVSSEISRSAS